MEEVKEELVEKKYILHTPKAPDIFVLASIIGKIGVNKFATCLKDDEVQNLIKDITKKKSISNEDISMVAGIGVFTSIAQIVLEGMPKCEEDVYRLLSNTSNLSLNEVKDLDGVTFVEMIIDFFKSNMDFIKAASKLVK